MLWKVVKKQSVGTLNKLANILEKKMLQMNNGGDRLGYN